MQMLGGREGGGGGDASDSGEFGGYPGGERSGVVSRSGGAPEPLQDTRGQSRASPCRSFLASTCSSRGEKGARFWPWFILGNLHLLPAAMLLLPFREG